MLHKRFGGRSAFRKLMILLLAILIPLYVITIFIYQWGLRTLQQEISNSMTYQVSTSITNLETDFERALSLLYDALSDTDLNALANISDSMNDIERMERMLRLQKKLYAISNSSQYIQDVYAYIPAIRKSISSLTVNELDLEEFKVIRALQYNWNSPLFQYRNKPHIAVGYPFLSPSSKRELTSMLSIEFSLRKLEQHLQAMKKNDGEGIVFSNSSFILHANDHPLQLEELIAAVALQHSDQGSFVWTYNDEDYLTVYQMSPFFDAVLIKYIPTSVVFASLAKFKTYFYVLSITSSVILLLYSLALFKYIHKPLEKLVRAFRRVEGGDMTIRVHHNSQDEFHYIYLKFNDMLDNIDALFNEVYKQKLLNQRAELKQLQSQINPHFLYNSFFILNTMARLGDNDQLERFTLQLGEYFQFITKNNAENVLLAKEIQHAKIYADIQGMRFSNRTHIHFDELPGDIGHVMVPRLILQPLIENAFEHALEKKSGNGRLSVSFTKLTHCILLCVDDNGNELDEQKVEQLNRNFMLQQETDSTGISNIHQRISLMFGEKSGLRFELNEWRGLKAIITINLEEE